MGWYVTGYPWQSINTPEHKKFLAAYQKRYNDYPRLGSIVGYATLMTAAGAIKKATSLDQEKLVGRDERPAGRHAVRQRSPTARSIISPPWAPMSAGRR